MADIKPDDIEWLLGKAVHKPLKELRRLFGTEPPNKPTGYQSQVRSMRTLLCAFFNQSDHCRTVEGMQIANAGRAKEGRKVIKMRWPVPGGGKRGGLRLIFLVDCEARQVALVAAQRRRDEMSEDDVDRAVDAYAAE